MYHTKIPSALSQKTVLQLFRGYTVKPHRSYRSRQGCSLHRTSVLGAQYVRKIYQVYLELQCSGIFSAAVRTRIINITARTYHSRAHTARAAVCVARVARGKPHNTFRRPTGHWLNKRTGQVCHAQGQDWTVFRYKKNTFRRHGGQRRTVP